MTRQISEISQVVYALLSALIHPEVLIFANQNSPKPAYPFWTVSISPYRKLGTEDLGQEVDDKGNLQVVLLSEATVTVQRVGLDSDTVLQTFCNELILPSVRAAWWAAKIAMFRINEIKFVPYMVDSNNNEPRAVVELFIRFQTTLMDNVGIIDTLSVHAVYGRHSFPGGFEPDPDLTETFTIVL